MPRGACLITKTLDSKSKFTAFSFSPFQKGNTTTGHSNTLGNLLTYLADLALVKYDSIDWFAKINSGVGLKKAISPSYYFYRWQILFILFPAFLVKIAALASWRRYPLNVKSVISRSQLTIFVYSHSTLRMNHNYCLSRELFTIVQQ